VNAAAAKFSRVKAVELYGQHRPFGYLHGPSGGAFQTITSMEQTEGVWDGAVPQVMGCPNAIPGVFTVRIHALRVLKAGDKFTQIMDAIDPGGSGHPYEGLDDEERAALEEATRLGFPMRGWWNWETMTGGPLRLVAGYVPLLDPTYVEDFWSKPGYLGLRLRRQSLVGDRCQVVSTARSPTRVGNREGRRGTRGVRRRRGTRTLRRRRTDEAARRVSALNYRSVQSGAGAEVQ
jgi:hypothetical protein